MNISAELIFMLLALFEKIAFLVFHNSRDSTYKSLWKQKDETNNSQHNSTWKWRHFIAASTNHSAEHGAIKHSSSRRRDSANKRPGMWTSSPGSLCIEPHCIFQNHLCWGLHQLQFCPVNSVAVRRQLKGSKAKCPLKVFANICVSCERNQALLPFFLVTSS